jgi:hypothetical protein
MGLDALSPCPAPGWMCGGTTENTVILTSTEVQIQGYWITAYKGIVQAPTWDDLLRNAEHIGANAVLNTCFDDALDVDTLFHGYAVVLKRERSSRGALLGPIPRRNRQPLRSDK